MSQDDMNGDLKFFLSLYFCWSTNCLEEVRAIKSFSNMHFSFILFLLLVLIKYKSCVLFLDICVYKFVCV